MLLSLGMVFLAGFLGGKVADSLKMPRLLAYLLAGMALGPFGFDLLEPALVDQAAVIRQAALMIILIKAGLTLNFKDLVKVGRPAVMMCFVPALCEILGISLFAPALLDISYVDGLLLASVLAAVSPAVLVPRMSNLMDRGLGTQKAIPQLILAGGTMDDILIFVLFAGFMQLSQGGTFSWGALVNVPLTLLSGVLVGLGAYLVYRSIKMEGLLGSLTLSLLLMGMEAIITHWIPYSGVLSVLTLHIMIHKNDPQAASYLARSFNQIWPIAEVLLFTFLGVQVNGQLALQAGWPIVCVIVVGLIFRMGGVFLSIAHAGFSDKEKAFIMGAYLPKATVQASLGGIPLMAGIQSGQLILIAASVAILLTAPLGAVFIDYFAPRFLEPSNPQ
ncbi:cation:proton antiporter [Facklamia hominis]|uniref:cation:proton antiporter domain-containing protein n=1 Tax=Facklamia hominis TaxID=178214 RepID=UPI00101D8E23|nr:cation:proton antiporter [Facklamia hominis]RYC98575.1 hypothetical protein EKN08_02635 [Facklamia hominis]